MVFNKEYFDIEKFLANQLPNSISGTKLNFHVNFTVKDTLPEPYNEYPPYIRVGIRSKKVNKEAQEFVKDWFKDMFGLDKPHLEREYGSTDKEILYEILYKVPEELYDKLKVLSKIK